VTMRLLTVQQPWADLIADGRKTLELRSWTTKYRGPVLILAAMGVTRHEHSWPVSARRGLVVAEVVLLDVRVATQSDEAGACLLPPSGSFAWHIRLTRRPPSVRWRGTLGLTRAPDDLLELLEFADSFGPREQRDQLAPRFWS